MPAARTRKPLFITLEGTEGSGKSTLISALKIALEARGISSISTREPGGAKLAEKIRALLINDEMHPMTELFLYEAARSEHLHTVILPALEKGYWVLCDRFTDSSLAYQGTARGIDRGLIRKLNGFATANKVPDVTVFLDIDPEAGLVSVSAPNRFEREGVDFQNRVRKGFLQTIKEEPKRFIKLRAKNGNAEEMAARCIRKLEEKLKTKFKVMSVPEARAATKSAANLNAKSSRRAKR